MVITCLYVTTLPAYGVGSFKGFSWSKAAQLHILVKQSPKSGNEPDLGDHTLIY